MRPLTLLRRRLLHPLERVLGSIGGALDPCTRLSNPLTHMAGPLGRIANPRLHIFNPPRRTFNPPRRIVDPLRRIEGPLRYPDATRAGEHGFAAGNDDFYIGLAAAPIAATTHAISLLISFPCTSVRRKSLP